MKLKNIAAALAVGLFALSAQASTSWTYQNTFDVGATDGYLKLGLGVIDPQSFTYTFSTTGISSVDLSFWYTAFGINPTVTLASTTQTLTQTGLLSLLVNPGAGGSSRDSFFSNSLSGLSAGTYSLTFSTHGLGRMNVDDVKMVVTSVPEPEGYAMLLAGLGVMGWVARRRSQK